MRAKVIGLLLVLSLSQSVHAQEVQVQTLQLDQTVSLDGLSVGNNHILYGTAGFDGTAIYTITREGSTAVFVDGLNGPIDMDFDHMGNMFVSTFNDAGLFKINPQGETARYATVTTGPSGVAVRRDLQQVFVSHYGFGLPGNGNAVYIADTSGFATSFVFGQGLIAPVSLAIDEHGNLYTPNIADARLFKITPDKTLSLLAQLPTSSRHPFNIGHIAYARGKLYLTGNSSQPFVFEVNLDGTFRTLAGSGSIGGVDGPGLQASFNAPNGIAASLDGDTLFISELNRPDAIRLVIFPKDTSDILQGHRQPQEFKLHQNFPNPFNPQTTIEFELLKTSAVKLEVFDLLGNNIRTLVGAGSERPLAPGIHQYVWNGRDSHNNRVSSGVYVYRLQAGKYAAYRKTVLVR